MSDPGPASRIGRYQLVAPIGAGGMGRVWVALDTAAPGLRLVALKTTLGGDASSGPDFWAMLSDEASLASRIDHPNVCATYELGQEAGIHFLVMEWSDGASLRDVLDATANKRVSAEVAALICARVAAGLHAAHELIDDDGHGLGVVHRDVSPQNILVSTRGHIRLADFGVAKARGQQHRPTETGEVKGKLSYMAPEQITSRNIDRRADVFALGCVLYEAALGVRAFHGADAMATMYKILEQPVATPSSIDASFPQELEAVLLKALAKDPAARYATAEDFGTALVEYLSSTRRSFTDKHVAELLTGPLGDKLSVRNRSIHTSAERLRRGDTSPGSMRSPLPPAHENTLTPEGGVERSLTLGRYTATPGASWPKWAAGVGVLALVALGAQRLWTPPTPATPSSASERVTAAAPPPTSVPSPVTAVEARNPVVVPAPSVDEGSTPPAHRGARGPVHVVQPLPAAVASSAPQPKSPVRKPRPIDRDNPFDAP